MCDMLTVEEHSFYSRQITVPQIGETGQLALKRASVLVVGAGGLGCPILLYLAAAGVGRIGIADADLVSLSNLHRQVIYGVADCRETKVRTAAAAMRARNPFVEVVEHVVAIDDENVSDMISGYDIIVDGTDNFTTKFLLNDACWFLSKPLVYGSIHRFEGQVAVFNHAGSDATERGPNYRDLFPSPPPAALAPDCSTVGVLGVLPGIVGCLQANEVIKLITGIGEPLSGTLLLVDALSGSTKSMRLKKNPNNPLSGTSPSIRNVRSVTTSSNVPDMPIRSISANTLIEWHAQGRPLVLVDVREPDERKRVSLGGVHWPLSESDIDVPEIDATRIAVMYCQSGARSKRAAEKLIARGYAREHLVSLDGGVTAFLDAGYRPDALDDPMGGGQ
ncbi:molybdopterin-synthase adenylyltransferase MoeB [Burkholderia stagnalis]|uniref:molybdopterin-synthase adenylyltransferase MoeB n=1 Tax=Burkholderia stagnalis TaxID=1503054 RepID=UPI00075F50E1|nr:molybdopterin-synthase adenylyltransferase MoeB [Burkholderia stagnalis]KVL85609.1 hypothetical protein WT02_32430 [Burkholderia stagnalis]KVL99770.1 hypothetical protein WT03_04090 [Burkholderia stagnalis]KVM12518.1 hypothetical protein WT04_11780 [Burkholderia stagnalis]